MGTTTVRIREQDHKEIRNIAEQADATIPAVMSEVLEKVDLDELLEQATGEQAVGICPECGTEIPADSVETAILSGSVIAQCPSAERDDDVHVDQAGGQYRVTELDGVQDE